MLRSSCTRRQMPAGTINRRCAMANEKKDWVVTTSGDRPLAEVAKDLKKSGFQVGQVLHEMNVINGEGGHHAAGKARQVKSVTDVSASVGVDIGPPGSHETW